MAGVGLPAEGRRGGNEREHETVAILVGSATQAEREPVVCPL